jgi:hypothetical protein
LQVSDEVPCIDRAEDGDGPDQAVRRPDPVMVHGLLDDRVGVVGDAASRAGTLGGIRCADVRDVRGAVLRSMRSPPSLQVSARAALDFAGGHRSPNAGEWFTAMRSAQKEFERAYTWSGPSRIRQP